MNLPRTFQGLALKSSSSAILPRSSALLGPVENLARLVAGQGQLVVRQRRPAGRQADRPRLRCGRTRVGHRRRRRCRQHRHGNRAEERGMRRLKACLRGPADAHRTAGPRNREVIVWVVGGRWWSWMVVSSVGIAHVASLRVTVAECRQRSLCVLAVYWTQPGSITWQPTAPRLSGSTVRQRERSRTPFCDNNTDQPRDSLCEIGIRGVPSWHQCMRGFGIARCAILVV